MPPRSISPVLSPTPLDKAFAALRLLAVSNDTHTRLCPWFPTSRYHLYTLLPVIPVALGEGCRKVNTAVALTGEALLYGTNNELYLSLKTRLIGVLRLPAVSQVDVLVTHDLLALSGRWLLVGPLHLATGADPALLYRRLVVLSSDASFFQVGEHKGKHVVCVAYSGRFSSQFKLLEAIEVPPGASRSNCTVFSFYLPDRSHSVHIWNKTIGAALRTGFQCVDLLSLVTFPVPVGPAPPLPDGLPSRKARAMFRVGERFNRCAFFIDKAALHYPYLLAFTGAGMHVWRVDSGVCVQTVHGGGIRSCGGGADPGEAA
ncbi:hypothetical protein FB451DRAFT_1388370 [Mycena latifolia]|nr:hypothetical protein FB451DRAFT_1388370 [Mycena latifolia]